MFKSLTYKHKTIILVFLILLFSITAYNLAVKKTIQAKAEVKVLKQKLNNVDSIHSRINKKQTQFFEIEQIIGSHDSKNLHITLMNKISKYCDKNDLILLEYPQVHNYLNGQYNIETYNIQIEGGFVDLLKLLYEVEVKYFIGRLASVKFFTKKDLKTKKIRLRMSVYIHNIHKGNSKKIL